MASQSVEPGRKAPYSPDVRWRVLWQRTAFEFSFRKIAENLSIAPSTARAIFKMFEEAGDVVPKTQPKREDTRCLDTHHEVFVIALVMECPSMYQHEICKAIEVATRACVSEATICRILRKNGLTRKKIRTVAVDRRTEYQASFMARALSSEQEMLVFLDETGSDALNYTRKFSMWPTCRKSSDCKKGM